MEKLPAKGLNEKQEKERKTVHSKEKNKSKRVSKEVKSSNIFMLSQNNISKFEWESDGLKVKTT